MMFYMWGFSLFLGLVFSRTKEVAQLRGEVKRLKAIAGSIAHELRTPLGSIQMGAASVAKRCSRSSITAVFDRSDSVNLMCTETPARTDASAIKLSGQLVPENTPAKVTTAIPITKLAKYFGQSVDMTSRYGCARSRRDCHRSDCSTDDSTEILLN